MQPPILDSRKASDFEAAIQALIPAYLPAWQPGLGESGWAVAQAFGKMSEQIAARLNGVPEKLFLAYLDQLGFAPGPARPARAPVQFWLRKKGADSARIPSKSRLLAKSKAIFETTSEFSAQKAALEACFVVDGPLDTIGDLWPQLLLGEDAPLDAADSLQSHELYLKDDKLFRFARALGDKQRLKLRVPLLEGAQWFYWGKDKKGMERWIAFKQHTGRYYSYLEKKIPAPSMPTTLNDEQGYWIKAVSGRVKEPVQEDVFAIRLSAFCGIDAMFCNDIPIDSETEFYPFGKEPKLQDAWYIGATEAFSKSGHKVQLLFGGFDSLDAAGDATLSWEYWDGKAWQRLAAAALTLKQGSGIGFTVPDEIAPLEYNGIESYWIRLRITAGGYAQTTINTATIEASESTSGGVKTTTFNITQNAADTTYTWPELTFVHLLVKGSQESFQGITTLNNLTYERYGKVPQTIFYALDGEAQTLYLGFDLPFDSGLVSLFFALAPRQVKRSRSLELAYADNRGEWTALKAEDASEALQKNGTLGFLSPSDQSKRKLFGTEGYWIRLALIPGTSETDQPGTSPSNGQAQSTDNPCPESERAFELPPGSGDVGDILRGIFPNTVWAEQLQSVESELLGSSDASAQQLFDLQHAPAFEPTVWVLEPIEPESENESRFDTQREGYWVAYRAVSSLGAFDSDARVFMLQSAEGRIVFGDGEHGRIPPPGRDNILVAYRFGGGTSGNGDAGTIDKVISAIPAVQAVANPLAASGGSDAQEAESIIQRAPAAIRHRERGINRNDLEALAFKASGDIARARLFLALNAQGIYGSGGNTMVIIPASNAAMPKPSFTLRETVESYIRARIAAVSSFAVMAPEYLCIHVDATLTTGQISLAGKIEEEARQTLASLLHPLTGKTDGSGWDFGEAVYLSDIVTWLEGIEAIESVRALEMVLEGGGNRMTLSFAKNHPVALPPYALIASGEHTIRVEEA